MDDAINHDNGFDNIFMINATRTHTRHRDAIQKLTLTTEVRRNTFYTNIVETIEIDG